VEGVTLDVAAAVAGAGGRSLVASAGGLLEGRLARDGARLIRLPLDKRNPVAISANAARLAAVIRRERASLVHVRSRAPAFSALLAARATGRPLVATYHGIYSARSGLKRWYNAIMTRGDLVIANSEFTRRHVLAEHGTPHAEIAVIPEGIDTEVFDPAAVSAARVAAVRRSWGLEEGEPRRILLLAARLTALKGQRQMIAAIGKLTAPRDVLLILTGAAGRDAYMVEVGAAARVAGVADNVRLVGDCRDMPAAFLAADLVVAPSMVPESFGRTVVEAAAMERPVLASALGGPAETLVHGKTGWLAPPGDAAAWARAVEAALGADEATRRAMGVAARERVKRLYSLGAMCEATFSAYRRVLESRR
jgi:glycosyltransferase involved in cell wall biosynthesis